MSRQAPPSTPLWGGLSDIWHGPFALSRVMSVKSSCASFAAQAFILSFGQVFAASQHRGYKSGGFGAAVSAAGMANSCWPAQRTLHMRPDDLSASADGRCCASCDTAEPSGHDSCG